MGSVDMILIIIPFRVAAVGARTRSGFMISFVGKNIYFMLAVTL
jgi:hypothetical protein